VPDPEPWQTNAPGPFLTIRAGGPFDGVVTLTAIPDGHGRTFLEVSWTQDGQACSESLEVPTLEAAHAMAHTVADELAAGTPPDLTRD
jgi:hypothetical protein